MLFTNIQLVSFNPTMARFIEQLAIECAEEREWLMMAVMNIGAILEYGKAGGMVRRFGGLGAKEGANAAGGALQAQVEITMMRVMAKKAAAGVPGAVRTVVVAEEGMDVDDEGIDMQSSQWQKQCQTWNSHQHSIIPSNSPSPCYLSYSKSH